MKRRLLNIHVFEQYPKVLIIKKEFCANEYSSECVLKVMTNLIYIRNYLPERKKGKEKKGKV